MLIDFRKAVSSKDIENGIRSKPDFRSTAIEWFDETQFYERRISLAPFIASGATLLAASTAFISVPVDSMIAEAILPMLWMLIVSMACQFIGGIFYVFSASGLRVSYTNRGNAEQLFNNFCDALVKTQIEKDNDFNLELQQRVPSVVKETNELIEVSNYQEKTAFRKMLVARLFVLLGFSLFVFSIISPLAVVSCNRNFGWF